MAFVFEECTNSHIFVKTTAMKRYTPWIVIVTLTILCTVFGVYAQSRQKPQQDPVLTFKLTLPQTTNIIYSLRNSTFLDAKTGNELADILVSQANDTTMNKIIPQQQRPTPKQK